MRTRDVVFANEWEEMEWYALTGLSVVELLDPTLESYAMECFREALSHIALCEDPDLCWELVSKAITTGKAFCEVHFDILTTLGED